MAAPLYSVGTATLTAGSTAMVGQGTLFSGNARAYDMVIGKDGKTNFVLSVNSNTSITLLLPWGGATQAAQPYVILPTSDDPFTQQLARSVLQAISASALVALGGLVPAARKGVYFDATAAAALFDLSDLGRDLLAGTTSAQMRTTMGAQPVDPQLTALAGLLGVAGSFTRWTGAASAVMQAIVGVVSQSGGTPDGALFELGSIGGGNYVRLANGTQACWTTLSTSTSADVVWNYPAAFSAAPTVFACPATAATGNISVFPRNDATTAGVSIAGYDSSGRRAFAANELAIGRWF